MKIQIWGKSKCFDTKKAERYFKERRIPYQAIDLLRYGMSRGELTSVKNAVGLDTMLNPKAAVFALAISTVFEGYVWTVPAIGGLFAVLIGNLFVLRR